jgi:hypothetical protein
MKQKPIQKAVVVFVDHPNIIVYLSSGNLADYF